MYMKISSIRFICPKCKEEYFNRFLASYSSGFEEAAESFVNNNKIITTCQKCGTKLVSEDKLNYYNNGEYLPLTEQLELTDECDEFDIYLKVLKSINNFFQCNEKGSIEIVSSIEDKDVLLEGVIIINGKFEDSNFELLKVIIDRYEKNKIGDRKNYFMQKQLANTVNAVGTGIFEYLFIDDCSQFFNKKSLSNISYKLENIE